MDYVRVDWSNGCHEYFKNDTLCADGTYRSAFLLSNNFYYLRIKRIKRLPEGCKIGKVIRHNKYEKDWEIKYD